MLGLTAQDMRRGVLERIVSVRSGLKSVRTGRRVVLNGGISVGMILLS